MAVTISKKLNLVYTDEADKKRILSPGLFSETVSTTVLGEVMTKISVLDMFAVNGLKKFVKPVEAVIVETKKDTIYTAPTV